MTSLSERLSTRKLKGPESEPVTLVNRRIYILPTRHGVLFALVLLVMLFGSINYNNSLGYALTFLLGGVATVSILHTHRNLSRLVLHSRRTEPVFAGQTARFTVCLHSDTGPAHYAIAVQRKPYPATITDVPVDSMIDVPLKAAARRRGRLRPGRFMVYTEFPVGLFHAWSWVELDASCVVYPKPEDAPSPPSVGDPEAGDTPRLQGPGQEDFDALRSYKRGDSPRHIAWKRISPEQELLTKQFAGGAGKTVWLDWDSLQEPLVEVRLSRLCRWVLDCQQAGDRYGLRLPGNTIEPATGAQHMHRCLEALALFETKPPPPGAERKPAMQRPPRTLVLPPAKTLWLLLAQAAVIAPHVTRLPVWITGLCLLLGAWRYLASRRYWRPVGRLVRLLLVAAGAGGVLAAYGTLFGRDAGVALLILMLSLKLLELNSLRDIMLFLFLGYFLVITNFLYSQSMPMAVYMFATVLVLTASLIVVNHPAKETHPWTRLRQAGVLLLQALPIMLILFVLFPRVPGPLWNLPKDAVSATTGLSDTMSPGTISHLSRSNAVAFRVDFDGPVPAPRLLYWRGPVLWNYDGRTWSARTDLRRGKPEYRLLGAGVRYTVTLEPHDRLWLFAMDLPGTVPSDSHLTADYELLSRQPVRERLRYRVTSYPHYTKGAGLTPAERKAALRLPARVNPRTRELARSLRRKTPNDSRLVARVLEMFRNQPFVYTLDPPALGANSVDEFLFQTRRGFCEHYASAFVVLMRDAGIPARVVTGYQGGEYNPIGGYLIVRQSDAHAWAEVWLKHRGWTRVDPTAAISPERIESGIEAALPAREAFGGFVRSDNTIMRQLALFWDSMNNGWNQWILGYGPDLQIEFLSRLGFGRASWKGMGIALAAAVGATLTLIFVSMLLRGRGGRRDPVSDAYQAFCNKLSRYGVRRKRQEGPLDYAARVAAQRPDLAGRVRRITQLYIALRYGPTPDHDQLTKLRELVKRFSGRRRRR